MSKIITVNDINSSKFYQLPKAFFHNPLYKNMKNESKIAYSILRDLLDLSIKNNWVNEKSQVYVKLSREKLMKYLNIKGKQKITQIMNELKKKELIVEKQIGINKCNEIYICIPDELNIVYSDRELLDETTENTMTFENQTSKGLKIKTQEVRKSKLKTFENQTLTKTNLTKTYLTNTEEKRKSLLSLPPVDNFFLSMRGETGEATFNTFIKPLELKESENKITLIAPSDFVKGMLENKLLDKIQKSVKACYGIENMEIVNKEK